MSKLFLLTLLLIKLFPLFSLDHGPIMGFSLGYNIYNQLALDSESDRYTYYNDNSLSIQLKMGYRVERLRIIGSYTNLFNALAIDSYMPLQDDFSIEVSYDITPQLKITFNHTCKHTIMNATETVMNYGKRSISISYYEEF